MAKMIAQSGYLVIVHIAGYRTALPVDQVKRVFSCSDNSTDVYFGDMYPAITLDMTLDDVLRVINIANGCNADQPNSEEFSFRFVSAVVDMSTDCGLSGYWPGNLEFNLKDGTSVVILREIDFDRLMMGYR